LTYLLQDCLSGQSKCLMFCQVSPALSSAGESLCSLLFAQRAKNTDLGVAKKNKVVAAAAAAAVSSVNAAAAAEAKKEAAAAAAAAKAAAKAASKSSEAELNAATSAAAKASREAKQSALALAEARDTIERLQAQLKEAAQARDKAVQQSNAATAALLAKERDMLSAHSAAAGGGGARNKKSAWGETVTGPAAELRRTAARGAAALKIAAPAAIDQMEDQESTQENAAPTALSLSLAGKKRKSGDVINPADDVITQKKQVLQAGSNTSSSRIVAPQVLNITSSGAQTARTRRQIAEKTVQSIVRPATARSTRAAAAAANTSLQASPSSSSTLMSPTRNTRGGGAANMITPVSSSAHGGVARGGGAEVPLSDDGWQSHEVVLDSSFSAAEAIHCMAQETGPTLSSPAPSSSATTSARDATSAATNTAFNAGANAGLSVMEQARRKIEERRKQKSERAAAAKKATPTAGPAAAGRWM
jgi:hypothetical protein